jgi:hypothetical protein
MILEDLGGRSSAKNRNCIVLKVGPRATNEAVLEALFLKSR